MATITTRAGKGSPLTNTEVDNNFTNINTELGQKESASNKGVANGYASLDGSGKVPSTQLPSYVDDVVEAANFLSLPGTGETGKIYVTLDTNKTYRWSGSAYVEISASPGSTDAVTEGSTNLYFTNARARSAISATGSLSYNSSTGVMSFTDAVTSVAGKTGAVTLTNSDVGLGNVENKSSATIRGELTSGNVTTALGFTPYNATNPSGYITSSSNITGNAATATTATRSTIEDTRAAQRTPNNYDDYRASYEFTDRITGLGDWHTAFTMQGWHDGYAAWQIIGPASTSAHENWYLRSGINSSWNPVRAILHAGNYTSYSLPITGGTLTGAFTVDNALTTLRKNAASGAVEVAKVINSGGGYSSYIYIGANPGADWLIGKDCYGAGNDKFQIGSWNGYAYIDITYNTTSGTVNFPNNGALTVNGNQVLHAGNYSSYALPLSGGTISGTVSINGGGSQPLNVTTSSSGPWGFGLTRSDANVSSKIFLHNGSGSWAWVYEHNPVFYNGGAYSAFLNSSNYSSYALPLSGGTTTGSIFAQRSRLGFSSNDANHSIYNNYSNIDGEGGWDGMKMNVYLGLQIRTGNASGAVPTTVLDISASAVNSTVALRQGGNQVLHAGNYSSYALPLSGGTVTGSTTFNSAVVIGGRDTRYFENDSFIEFYVAGDANTYYPVRFSPSVWFHFARWSISRGYADTAPWDPIGTGVHRGGLTLTWEWSGDGAWGGNDKTIRVSQFSEQYTTMVGGLALSVNGIIVWLRGGNAYYRFHGPGGVMNGVTQYYSTFTASDGSTYSPRSYNSGTVASEVTNRMPVRGVAELYDGGNRVLHAGNYSSYAPTLTGGGASGTWGISITGNAATATSATDSTKLPLSGGTVTGFLGVGGNPGSDDGGWGARLNVGGNPHARIDARCANDGIVTTVYSHQGQNRGYVGTMSNHRLALGVNGSEVQSVYSGYSESIGSYRAPIFYDSNDTSYYGDFSAGTALKYLRLNGDWGSSPFGSGHAQLTVTGTYASMYQTATNGSLGYMLHHIASDGSYYMYGGRGAVNGSDWNWGLRVLPSQDGNFVEFRTSARAPIFYDLDDTGYYLDPNGSTALFSNGLVVAGNSGFQSRTYVAGRNRIWSFNNADAYGISYFQGSGGIGGQDTFGVHFGNTTASGSVLQVNQLNYTTSTGSLRAPLFYDSDNTGYYCDPNSTSYLYHLILSGASYFRPSNWIQLDGAYGLYWPNNYGLHVRANDQSTYTQLCIQGSKNSYGGILDLYSSVNGIMYDSGGNGGVYREANGRWYFYHHVGNNCMGVGTSTTSSAYGIYAVKGGYFDGRVDGTIFYDANNTGYYLDPTSTTALRTVGSWRADSASWDGEFSGKIQYHSSHWYFQYGSLAIFRNAGGSNVLQIDQSGNLTAQGNVTAYSDRRLKENVSTLSGASDYLARIDAKTFRWKSDGRNDIGFIAQDVEEAGLPEFVIMADTYNPATGETADPIKSLDYGRMVSVLWQAVKEQQSQIAAMSAEVNSLKEKLQ